MTLRHLGPLMGAPTDRDSRIREYWEWITVALFLLVTVDMITTVYAVEVNGLSAEANPIVKWALAEGMVTFALLNLVAVVLVVVMFHALTEVLRVLSPPYDRVGFTVVEVWLGLMLAAGFLIFANNLVAIFFGVSLL